MIILKDIEMLSGYSRAALSMIMSRNQMRTKLADVAPGKARYFSRENVLELCFMRAVMPVERDVISASVIAGHWLLMEKQDKLPKFWSFNSRKSAFEINGDIGGMRYDSELSFEALKNNLPDKISNDEIVWEDENSNKIIGKPAVSILTIGLREICDSVDWFIKLREKGGK